MSNNDPENSLNELLASWFESIYPICTGDLENPAVKRHESILTYYIKNDMWNKSGCCQLKEQIEDLKDKLTIIEVEHTVNNKTFDGKETNISKLINLYEDYCRKLARVLFDYGAGLSNIQQRFRWGKL